MAKPKRLFYHKFEINIQETNTLILQFYDTTSSLVVKTIA